MPLWKPDKAMGTGIGVGTFGEVPDMKQIAVTNCHDSLVPTDKAGFEALKAIPLGEVLECSLETKKISRSALQNRTLWGWLADMEKTTVNEYSGRTSHEWHRYLKYIYLCPIFIRDDPGYAEMIKVLHDIKDIDGYEALRDGVIDLTSTTKCSVEQFSEYLGNIERFCHERGIALRTDPVLLAQALGRE